MVNQYGAGLSSARFICGTQDIHLELEKKVAELHNAEDAILYAACFDANAGIFEVVLNKVILKPKMKLKKALWFEKIGEYWN